MGVRVNQRPAGDAEAAQPAAKRRRSAEEDAGGPSPEELVEGTPVVYWGEYHGLIRDAFAPLDQFWITDSETGKIVRDETGEIVQFGAADLQLLADAVPQVGSPAEASEKAGVFLIGREEHMVKILEHFGPPSTEERCNPQQLLAIPCNMCEQEQLAGAAAGGVREDVLGLARKIRPDIHVGVRATQVKQAAERIGPELLLLEGYYCLSSVQLPYSLESIASEAMNEWERHSRKDLFNQVDLSITATAELAGGDSLEAAARKALGETCGLEVSDMLWRPEVQAALRKRLGVAELSASFTDSSGMEAVVMLLPDDAVTSKIQGLLCFSEPAGADYLAQPTGPAAQEPSAARAEVPGSSADEQQVAGRTVKAWEAAQQTEFPGQPKLPPGWLRIKSRTTDQVYYFNKQTKQSTFDAPELPMPPGWTKHTSKSTGKVYYFHAQRRSSTFERPTA